MGRNSGGKNGALPWPRERPATSRRAFPPTRSLSHLQLFRHLVVDSDRIGTQQERTGVRLDDGHRVIGTGKRLTESRESKKLMTMNSTSEPAVRRRTRPPR